MKRSSTIWLAAAFAVVVVAGVLAVRERPGSQVGAERLGAKLLPGFSAADVAKVGIRHGADSITLARTEAGWMVVERDYPADEARIRDVLLKVRELKILQADPISAEQRARLELAAPGSPGGGVRVEFAGAGGKPLAAMVIGKAHAGGSPASPMAVPAGRYVLVEGREAEAAVVADPLSDLLVAKPAAWLSKSFVQIEHTRSIAVSGPDGKSLWTIRRDSDSAPWRFADSKAGSPDEAKANQVARAFESTGFTDVVGPLAANADRLEGATRVRIETQQGAAYELRIGREATPEQRYFGVSGGPAGSTDAFARWVYLMPTRAIEPLLRPRDQLLPDQPDAAAQKGSKDKALPSARPKT